MDKPALKTRLFVITALIILSTSVFITYHSPVFIFPEFRLLPWLTANGWIPYRDFFDHHGFLLSYVLAPFSLFSSDTAYHILFSTITVLNLVLLMSIAYRMKGITAAVIAGLLGLPIHYFFADQRIWYELFILPIYLLTLLFILHRKHEIGIGFLIALASFIKPTAALILVPTLRYYRSKSIAYGFIVSWIIPLLFFISTGGFFDLIRDTLVYNHMLSHSYRLPHNPDWRWLGPFLILTAILIFTRRIRNQTLVLGVLISCIVFFILGYERVHALPSMMIAVLFISLKLSRVNKFNLIKLLYVTSFCLYYGKKTISVYRNNLHTIPWQRRIDPASLLFIKQEKGSLYLLSNHGELYAYLNKLPVTRYPLAFEQLESFDQNLVPEIITALKNQSVTYIIQTKEDASAFSRRGQLISFIGKNYTKVVDTTSYTLWKKL